MCSLWTRPPLHDAKHMRKIPPSLSLSLFFFIFFSKNLFKFLNTVVVVHSNRQVSLSLNFIYHTYLYAYVSIRSYRRMISCSINDIHT
ncbi:hypothetical protein M432DRAFT_225924 [Thermoascus aurantiacus ATCC 26904]